MSTSSSFFSKLGVAYLVLSAIGYLLFGFVVCEKNGSIGTLLILVPGTYLTSFPIVIAQKCLSGATTSSSLIVMITPLVTIGIGLAIVASLVLRLRYPNWNFVLYAFGVIFLLIAIHNLLFASRFGNAVITLINALLFLLSAYLVNRQKRLEVLE